MYIFINNLFVILVIGGFSMEELKKQNERLVYLNNLLEILIEKEREKKEM